jgi:2'-deoxynucleoside 5'-phosphate N-hydrolase
MRIYFSGAISGGRDHLPIYQHIVARLKSLGHTVPTEHVADPDVLIEERAVSPRVVYDRDVAWIAESDAMIAEVSTPSLGVGYEIGYALQHGKPTLCAYRDGLFVSKMITGNPSPHLTVVIYRDDSELDRRIDEFLERRALPPGAPSPLSLRPRSGG